MFRPDQAGKGRLDDRGGAEPLPLYCKLLRLGTPAGINGRRRNRWSTWHSSVQYAQNRRSRCMRLNESDRGMVVRVSRKLQNGFSRIRWMTRHLGRSLVFFSTLLSAVRASGRGTNKKNDKIVSHRETRNPLHLVYQPTLRCGQGDMSGTRVMIGSTAKRNASRRRVLRHRGLE